MTLEIVNIALILLLSAVSFSAGVWLADRFNTRAQREQKDALERQYLRLQTRSDADDPCKPYMHTIPLQQFNTGDFDGDKPISAPIDESFMQDLKTNGSAKTRFRKSDVV